MKLVQIKRAVCIQTALFIFETLQNLNQKIRTLKFLFSDFILNFRNTPKRMNFL